MFSQFFEKKHLKINGTFKNLSQTGLNEHHTPKSSIKSLAKANCQSSQKLISTSPFNARSKSPISQTTQKNLTNTPKTVTTVPHKEKESEKYIEKTISSKPSVYLKKDDMNTKKNILEVNLSKNSRKIPEKDKIYKKNTYLSNPSNMRVQTLPDTTGLDFDSLMKYATLQKKPKPTEKKNYNFSKESEEMISKHEPDSYSSLKETNINKHFSDFLNRKETKEDTKKIPPERDLSNHSTKSTYSVNMVRKTSVKNSNMTDKTANYTIHIKAKESDQGLTLNEKLLHHVKLNEYEKCLEILEKNKTNKLLNVNFRGDNDWTPIHYAALNGNQKILNTLLYNDAIIDCETSSKLTPLMISCQKGYEEIAATLLRAGADINLCDLSGNSALHYAAVNGQKKIIELLLKKNSIICNIKNTLNKTPKESSSSNEITKIFDIHEHQKKSKETTNSHNIVIKSVKSEQFNKLFRKVSGGQKEIKDSLKNIKNPNENFSSTNTTATNNNSNNMTHNTLSFINNEEENIHENEKTPAEKDKVNLDSFTVHGLIGKGSFGEVYLVEKKDNESVFYAMKVLHKSKIMKNNLIKYALTERNVLSLMNHTFIVKLLYAFQTSDKLFLIMDFCPGGDLGQHLQREKKFSEERVRIYIAEIILALEDLHKRDIIFRDLKPDNIVLDQDGHAMLTDFGLSKEGVEESAQGARSFCGSVAYLAPEMLKRTGHGKAVDWYLLGVVMYEMLVGIPPYYANNKEELFSNIEKAPLKIPSYISPDAASLLKSLLQRNPSKRLGSGKGDAEEIKFHPFFKIFDWIDVENRKLKPPIPQKKIKINTNIGFDMLANIPNLMEDKNNHVAGWSFAVETNK